MDEYIITTYCIIFNIKLDLLFSPAFCPLSDRKFTQQCNERCKRKNSDFHSGKCAGFGRCLCLCECYIYQYIILLYETCIFLLNKQYNLEFTFLNFQKLHVNLLPMRAWLTSTTVANIAHHFTRKRLMDFVMKNWNASAKVNNKCIKNNYNLRLVQ